MEEYIIAFLVGVLCVILGISNMRGNLSSLHSYHRRRVSEEDRIPFGKKAGLGTIICGCAIMAYGVFSGLSYYFENEILTVVGAGLLIAGLVAGLGLSFYAMFKYNKGIF